MRLKDRIERIEQMMDRPRFGDGGGSGPTVIRIHGGLEGVEPLHATVGGLNISFEPGETERDFEDRVIELAVEMHAAFVVIGGMPPWPRIG